MLLLLHLEYSLSYFDFKLKYFQILKNLKRLVQNSCRSLRRNCFSKGFVFKYFQKLQTRNSSIIIHSNYSVITTTVSSRGCVKMNRSIRIITPSLHTKRSSLSDLEIIYLINQEISTALIDLYFIHIIIL